MFSLLTVHANCSSRRFKDLSASVVTEQVDLWDSHHQLEISLESLVHSKDSDRESSVANSPSTISLYPAANKHAH